MNKVENIQFNEMVSDGIRFLESLTRYYGPEQGMEVWEKLGEAVGDEVKGAVFFSMLTGEFGTKVRIQAGSCTQIVTAIKSIRLGTGCGLKEAKDAWDLSTTQVVTLDAHDRESKRLMVRDLRSMGMIVS